jgi:hypothetical protein
MKKIFAILIVILFLSISCSWLGVVSDTMDIVDEITNPQEQPKNPCPCDEN